MNAKELLILNFEEVRRRSIKVWKNISEEDLFWKPDPQAMTCIEMIRHVLESENIYHHIILHRGTIGDYESPLTGNPFTSVDDELKNAQPFREKFLKMVHSFSLQELDEEYIIRKEKNQKRKLGDYLLRVAYHESVHAGQLLSYLRTLNAPRAAIWD
ncbi:MAG: DinB family protein [Chitinophagaceae bacterium]|nr:DinB family protein [Chitinophagaceae bacterium]MBK7123143.1 DinB family protein [Chitinophagaceae bacterium]HQW92972.1 DinB family protein [Ferruginibacter sp.]